VIDAINPLWGEPDEAKRIAGWKAVSRLIADNGYVIPLFQYVQPVIHRTEVKVVPSSNGMLLPQRMTPAA
jgi:peptide/nickel transport system substrate-binding protein